MTLILLIIMSLIWLGSLILAMSVSFATVMLSDSGDADKLVRRAIHASFAYFVVVPLSVIVAWIAFLFQADNVVHVVIWFPLVNIIVFAFFLIRVFRRNGSTKQRNKN